MVTPPERLTVYVCGASGCQKVTDPALAASSDVEACTSFDHSMTVDAVPVEYVLASSQAEVR